MTFDDLEVFLRQLGMTVDGVVSPSETKYVVIHDVLVTSGPRAGKTCDVAIARVESNPFTMPSAIHTRPPLAPMDMSGPLKTRASELGTEWQYWSRRYDHPPTPKLIWVHILSVLNEDVS